MSNTSQYDYARKSSFSNLGEDVTDSARHRRNEAINLNDIENGQLTEKQVTRDELMKSNPLRINEVTDSNYEQVLTAYFILKCFPSKPKQPRYGKPDSERLRKTQVNYFKSYDTVKSFIERELNGSLDSVVFIEKAKLIARELIKTTRKNTDLTYEDYNLLISYHNNALYVSRWKSRHSKTSAMGKLEEFRKLAIDKTDSELIEAVQFIIDGKGGINKAFGIKGQAVERKQTFKRASIYAKDSKRVGPNSNRFANTKECTEYLMEVVNLRALQWGNSVPDSEREEHLRSLSFAFYDLARVTGLDAKSISQNGKLAMAIGARGRSGALAHYEPDLDVINLTRKNGFGSLAHEWAHFIDKTHGWMSEQYRPKVEVMEALSNHMTVIKRRIQRNPDFKDMTAKKRAYWTSNKEIFARCFEVFACRELMTKGELNNYLSGLDSHWLWPNEQEIADMANAFKELFQAIK